MFSKANLNCGKEKQMHYLVNQHQIHQFCIKLSQLLSCGLLSSCPFPCTPCPVCPELYTRLPQFISRHKNFLSRTEIDTVCLQSQAMCNVFLFTTRPRHPWHSSNAHFQVIHCIPMWHCTNSPAWLFPDIHWLNSFSLQTH